jgi:hypothetical protein
MPKFQLYKVGAHGRIALGDLVKEGDHYSADLEKDDDGNETVVLTKVDVITASATRRGQHGPLDLPDAA